MTKLEDFFAKQCECCVNNFDNAPGECPVREVCQKFSGVRFNLKSPVDILIKKDRNGDFSECALFVDEDRLDQTPIQKGRVNDGKGKN